MTTIASRDNSRISYFGLELTGESGFLHVFTGSAFTDEIEQVILATILGVGSNFGHWDFAQLYAFTLPLAEPTEITELFLFFSVYSVGSVRD